MLFRSGAFRRHGGDPGFQAFRQTLRVVLGMHVTHRPAAQRVLHLLRLMQQKDPDQVVCLAGNHEDMMVRAGKDWESFWRWVMNGGRETLASYGINHIDVAASYGDYYDMAALSDVFATKSSVVGARALPWYQPFQVKVGERIHALLLGQASSADTVKGLADDVRSVQSGGI